jgi:hypothetical protein
MRHSKLANMSAAVFRRRLRRQLRSLPGLLRLKQRNPVRVAHRAQPISRQACSYRRRSAPGSADRYDTRAESSPSARRRSSSWTFDRATIRLRSSASRWPRSNSYRRSAAALAALADWSSTGSNMPMLASRTTPDGTPSTSARPCSRRIRAAARRRSCCSRSSSSRDPASTSAALRGGSPRIRATHPCAAAPSARS